MTDKYAAAIEYARKLGAEHGTNAAAWYTQDAFGGRVTRGADESARRILDGIECGDPAILDTFPVADLSGGWADSLTGPALVDAAMVHVDDWLSDKADHMAQAEEWFGDICDAYESAFAEAASDEIERAARYALA